MWFCKKKRKKVVMFALSRRLALWVIAAEVCQLLGQDVLLFPMNYTISVYIYNIQYNTTIKLKTFTRKQCGDAVAQWLRHCATNRKVAGTIPDGVGFFSLT
jgi:hypothetical protein